jgi:hypothetical protein
MCLASRDGGRRSEWRFPRRKPVHADRRGARSACEDMLLALARMEHAVDCGSTHQSVSPHHSARSISTSSKGAQRTLSRSP